MKVIPTSTQNLCRDGDTGIYYARKKIGGKQYYRSLDTTAANVAKARLADKLKDIQASAPAPGQVVGLEPAAKVSELADLFATRVQNSTIKDKGTKLRPRATIMRTWPQFFDMEARRVTEAHLETYFNNFLNGKLSGFTPHNAKSELSLANSPSTVNKCRQYVNGLFRLAVKQRLRGDNPAEDIEAPGGTKKLLNLPTKDQWKAIVLHVRNKAGRGRIAGDLVEGLAYSGMRIHEARIIRWMDLDYSRGMMKVHGSKSYTSHRHIPMSGKFVELTKRMLVHRTKILGGAPKPDGLVFEAKEATMSLAKASVAKGMQKMTHHDLRDLFATTCIEQGANVATLADWLGHNDGGVLVLKVYGHVRPEVSTQAMAKIQFD